MLRISEEIGDETGFRFGTNNAFFLYNFSTGEYEEGLKLTETWTEKCRQMGYQVSALVNSNFSSWQYFFLGQYRKSLQILQGNFPIIEDVLGPDIRILLRFYIALLHFLLEEVEEGRQMFESTYKLFTENELDPVDRFFFWDQILRITQLYPEIYPLPDILEEIETCIRIFREREDLASLAFTLYSAADLHMEMVEQASGQVEKALAALDEAEKLKETVRVEGILIEQQLFSHARAHYLAGQDDEADRYLKQAYDWMMACAAKITTPEYRQSYLENVPMNREIARIAQERGLAVE